MKIISLNAWEGKIPTINKFIQDQSVDTDIFCLQESLNDKNQIFCSQNLKKYQSFYDKKTIDDYSKFYQVTFIKDTFKFINNSTLGTNDNTIGFGIFTQIETKLGIVNVCNFHGITRRGDDKLDTPDRLRQSQLIIDFFKKIDGPKIIVGDFNLDLNTESISLFEKNGYKNLIKEFNIKTTRNHFAWDKYPDKQLYADHFFISPEIKVTNFSVPNIEVSDHEPLILEFEI